MRARSTYWLALGFLLGLLAPSVTYATHVRAGEITTRRISPDRLTYEITLTAYYDEIGGRDAANLAEKVSFCLGDGAVVEVQRLPRVFINRRTTSINIYRFTYTYQGPGVYQISANIVNRNRNTVNLRQPSDEISFWIRTTIQVNAALGQNSTPVLTNPPLDSARVGQKFCHNPVAFDIDGDSLAYRMAFPQESTGAAICRGFSVNGYRDPARGVDPNAQNEARSGPATLAINPLTGDLCWDSPAVAGQYNIAFIVEEWRDGVLIGEITRDMQIIVTDTRNNRPLLDPIPDLCREAGSLIEVPLRGYDPDGQRVELTAFGGIFNRTPEGQAYNPPLIAAPFATLVTPTQPQSGTATALIRWQTACQHARTEEYDVLARIVDFPGQTANQLATLQSFRIKIIAPRPTGLTARPQVTNTGRAIRLNWNNYACAPTSTTASVMVVYRREGCNPIPSTSCTTGMPTSAGYIEIGTVPIGTTTFTDTTNLRRGVTYSYRIVARFAPVPLGGESVVSDQTCLELPLLAPLITQVTVDSTSAQRGQITVRWTRPIGLNPADGGSPFQYRVFRATGLTGTNFTQVTAINSLLDPTAPDTIFVDRGLNTEANAYRYRIDFFQTTNGQLTRVDATEPASSPRLTLNPGLRQIELVWATNTPWSNDNQTHRVYRSRRGTNTPLQLIAEVRVASQPYRFADTGTNTNYVAGIRSLSLSVDSNYCYRVETVGRYTSTSVYPNLLSNFSQVVCASPADTSRPCPPQLTLQPLDCSPQGIAALCTQTSFANQLNWTNPTRDSRGQTCDPNLVAYNIYYARTPTDPLVRVGSSTTPSFRHESLTTVAGCYYVTAVSRRGGESLPSNKVCGDVCPAFLLPNVFTPNGDGKNDVFTPTGCSLFVASVETVIYNRYGSKVYETIDPQINWDGRSSTGVALPSGLYYYEVRVVFAGLDTSTPPLVLRGWVQLFREQGANGG